jgi:hypothetical protein
MLAKKTSKNQLTLPQEIVANFPDVVYFDVSVKERKIILAPVRISPVDQNLEAIRDKIVKLGITTDDIEESVTWARKRNL